MQYHWRIWLWENGGKSTEYTDYAVAPIFIEDRLDETMDSGEIILDSMPIETRSAFPPKTKFRMERYLAADYSDTPKKYDLVVEHDDVEEYPGCPEICCHRVHLIEASVVAQGMHVDNIALTYELQDVDLNYKTVADDDRIVGDNCKAIPGGKLLDPVHEINEVKNFIVGDTYYFNRYFKNSYRYVWDNNSLNDIKALKLYYSAEKVNEVRFTIPKLICEGCYNTGEYTPLFQMNTITTVQKITFLNGAEKSRQTICSISSGAKKFSVLNDSVFYSDGHTAYLRAINDYDGPKHNMDGTSFDDLWSTHRRLALASIHYSDTVEFQTEQLDEAALKAGYSLRYQIECTVAPINEVGMIEYYEKERLDARYYGQYSAPFTIWTKKEVCAKFYDIKVEPITLYCKSMSNEAKGGPFLVKGLKYSCYDLIRKALLTVDTQIIDNSKIGLDSLTDENFKEIGIQYPIIVHSDWIDSLKSTKMQETIFENKNLWEVLLQIGYYLHAIPYLEFAEDGTDRFLLSFRQLGATKMKEDDSTKITVFNSRNLSEYFTQYDSYVTNMFSPQNVVEEWLVPKTSGSDYIIANDTAELKTSFPILEIIDFKIYYDGSAGGTAGEASILQYIFEESVYQILTSDDPIKVKPAKGNSIFYRLASDKIQGLNYVPPQVSNGSKLLSMQEICRRLFGISVNESASLKFNDLKFYIKYRTQDSLRITQIRPDIQNFVSNSAYEKYPHHEQFYGQQDKIIDSERFSANLFGKLIRVGNSIYQRQEYADATSEKESGDLVTLNNGAYYVVATENEYYPDAIFQKVSYSKNFNQLANIVTIPSEPRFYEVSERSKIRREVRLMDFFVLTTERSNIPDNPRFLNNSTWKEFLKGIIFARESVELPNFAYTKFIADYKRRHTGSYGQVVPYGQLFPSCEINRTNPNNIEPHLPKAYADCVVPLLHFPLHDGIAFVWNMEDNFKAGDFVDKVISCDENGVEKEAYLTLQPLRYVDVMGRADLFTFKLFRKTDWTHEQARALPKAAYIPSDLESSVLLQTPYTIGLDKDCREEISFNYQINLLHRAAEGDDDFITYPNLFGQKDSPLKMCLSSERQSMFVENSNFSAAVILADDVRYDLIDINGVIEIRIFEPNDIDLSAVKSIVLYQKDNNGSRNAYIAKNTDKLPAEKKLYSWWIYPVLNL